MFNLILFIFLPVFTLFLYKYSIMFVMQLIEEFKRDLRFMIKIDGS